MEKNGKKINLTSITESTTEKGVKIQSIQVVEETKTGKWITGRKTGFYRCSPQDAPSLMKDIEAGHVTLEFGQRNRQTGLYDIEVILSPDYEASLSAADAAANAARVADKAAGVAEAANS